MGALENALSEELGSTPPYNSSQPPTDAPPAPSRSSPKAARAKEEHKIIAAAVGATLTSLTMTPFDVIKTRLQTQAPPEPLFHPSSHLPPPSSRSSTSPWPPPVASTSTATAVTSSSSSTHPPLPLASTSAAATNAATCCRPTYFSTNFDASLLCRFDPRLSTSSLPASGSHTTATASTATLRHPPSSAFVHHLAPLSHQHTPTPSALLTSPSAAAASCIYPTPTAATLSLPSQSAPSASRHLTGFWDAVIKITRHEGLGAMWRGTGPTLAMSVPGQVVYMVGYDWGRRTAFERAPSWAYTTSSVDGKEVGGRDLKASYLTMVPLLAGSLSRTVVACLTSPLELVRTRLQSSSNPSTSLSTIYTSLRSEGLASAWRGLPPTLWRDVPFSGIYWAGYEGIKRSLTGGKGMGEQGAGGVWEEFGVAFVSGAGSGMIAATLTNPFDVVKTRRQALDTNAITAEALARGETPPPQLTKTFAIAMDIFKKEGMAGLMRGLTPRLAKVS
ncbi:mitochondrial carrier domain-containing protein [Leucosporidium creatinivorum]|uniref:Mitochondrial carrier domain-containing protein n=1 Tax=Leucosporidium creatinivorum TaxID=106004 RepID=A0A1Y2F2E4_9BASI|nr:mitochondrial carrier domain-containing protein [Leucosporidium creatinivorum]